MLLVRMPTPLKMIKGARLEFPVVILSKNSSLTPLIL